MTSSGAPYFECPERFQPSCTEPGSFLRHCKRAASQSRRPTAVCLSSLQDGCHVRERGAGQLFARPAIRESCEILLVPNGLCADASGTQHFVLTSCADALYCGFCDTLLGMKSSNCWVSGCRNMLVAEYLSVSAGNCLTACKVFLCWSPARRLVSTGRRVNPPVCSRSQYPPRFPAKCISIRC